VETKAGHFEPSKFEDQYVDALKELLKKKQEGKPIERPERPQPTNVVNLMDASSTSSGIFPDATQPRSPTYFLSTNRSWT
jgi:non-homologous end joining protein Ku